MFHLGQHIVPYAIQACKFLGDAALRKHWKNVIIYTKFDPETGNLITIRFKVDCGRDGFQVVELDASPDLRWFEACKCDCNWTLQSGRPCMHGSFCLKFPNLGGRLSRKDFFGDFTLERPRFYHIAFGTFRMRDQYSFDINIPQHKILENVRVFPGPIKRRAGNMVV